MILNETTDGVLDYNDYVNKFSIVDHKEEYPVRDR